MFVQMLRAELQRDDTYDEFITPANIQRAIWKGGLVRKRE